MRHGWRWSVRPPVGTPVDVEHPLARGLDALWPLTNHTVDLISGHRLTLQNGATFGVRGLVLDGSNDQALSSSAGRVDINGRSYTQFAVGIPGTVTANMMLMGIGGNGFARTQSSIGYRSTGTVAELVVNSEQLSVSIPTIVSGERYVLVATYDVNTNLQTLYHITRGGQVVSGTRTAGADISGSTNAVSFGSYAEGGSHLWFWSGTVELGGFASRPWTAREAIDFGLDPYQLFAPPVWRRYFVPAAGGGETEAAALGGLARIAATGFKASSTTLVMGVLGSMASSGVKASAGTSTERALGVGTSSAVHAGTTTAALSALARQASTGAKASTGSAGPQQATGTLSSVAASVRSASAALRAFGVLIATSAGQTPATFDAAAFIALARLTSSALKASTTTAALSGSTLLSATGAKGGTSTATITAYGRMALATVAARSGVAAFRAGGHLSAAGTASRSGAAAMWARGFGVATVSAVMPEIEGPTRAVMVTTSAVAIMVTGSAVAANLEVK